MVLIKARLCSACLLKLTQSGRTANMQNSAQRIHLGSVTVKSDPSLGSCEGHLGLPMGSHACCSQTWWRKLCSICWPWRHPLQAFSLSLQNMGGSTECFKKSFPNTVNLRGGVSLGTYSGHPHRKHPLPGCCVQGPPKRGHNAWWRRVSRGHTGSSCCAPTSPGPDHPTWEASHLCAISQRKCHQGKQPSKQWWLFAVVLYVLGDSST